MTTVKPKLDKNDKVWEAASLFLLVFHAFLLFVSLQSLPDTVAIHFDGTGKANGWGSKNILWLTFAIAILIYAFFTFISFRPGFYRSRMTEKNLKEQYRLTSKMARTLKAFILLFFIAVTIFMLQTARGKWIDEVPFLFLIMFVLIVPPSLIYIVKISKAR